MSDFENRKDKDGFTCKLWRGEHMTMLGFDVEDPEDDLVGFSIEVRNPTTTEFMPLRNRIAFSYPEGAGTEVTGDRQYPSTEAPFQKFRWIHFPAQPVDGTYRYRVRKMHMPTDGKLKNGTTLSVDIPHKAVTYDGLVDIGFTRNFASSQAYREQFGNNADIIPVEGQDALAFQKLDLKNDRGESVYDWLGFEAYRLLTEFLADAKKDKKLTLDVMAYDLNERGIVDALAGFGKRLRIIVDDSSDKKDGVEIGHKGPNSNESRAAAMFRAAGADVRRTNFHNLQHNKVFITRRDGVAEKVLCGSTNFTYRGLYIQANNLLVFHAKSVAAIFGNYFDSAWDDPRGFRDTDFAKTWHTIATVDRPAVQLCFSPHRETDLSLNPIAAAIDQATSSVFYSVAFLSQMTSGPTFDAFNRVINRPIFSYGTVDKRGGMELRKPDGSVGVVDFKYLSSKAPEPFKSEWSGGKGRNIHHKFLVTDFNLPTAKVFTGSSNFSPSGERGNGDHLILIEDRKVATAFAVEAARVFDHLSFRNRMHAAFGQKDDKLQKAKAPAAITLKKPTAISGKPAWFERFYEKDTQNFRDRKVFTS